MPPLLYRTTTLTRDNLNNFPRPRAEGGASARARGGGLSTWLRATPDGGQLLGSQHFSSHPRPSCPHLPLFSLNHLLPCLAPLPPSPRFHRFSVYGASLSGEWPCLVADTLGLFHSRAEGRSACSRSERSSGPR